MSTLARIAQLHRELAEAYEQLSREQQASQPAPRRTPARSVVPVEEQPSKATVDAVRRKLRRAGVAA